jgi:hypothetical protein
MMKESEHLTADQMKELHKKGNNSFLLQTNKPEQLRVMLQLYCFQFIAPILEIIGQQAGHKNSPYVQSA